MYPVSLDFQNKIKELVRDFQSGIQIQHSQGILNLTDKDLVLGSLSCTEAIQSGDEFTIGGTVAADLSFEILNKEEYDDIEFEGATVMPFIKLLLRDEVDIETYFIAAPQPSEFESGEHEEEWEAVPLGVFNIDDPVRLRNTITIKAIDNMIEFDKPYSLSKLSYPATLYQIYVNACNVCDVNVGTTDFPNKNYVVQERPDDDYTFRDIIGYVAELAGCFAKCDRDGAAEIRWYEDAGLELGPGNRYDFKPKDYKVQVKGIMATIKGEDGKETTYLTGTDDYAIDLSDNPLLQGDYETVLPNILNNIKDIIFTPYESSWQGNPAVQAGDLVKHADRDGNEYNTLITRSTYRYRNAGTMMGQGLPEKARGYKGSTNKRIAQVKRKIEKDVGDKLTTLEQAQLQAMELMSNMLGGHLIADRDNGILYIADNPDIELATKIWKWGLGGFGYTEDGGQTWETTITADGSIVAMLVAAGIITADMVQTGILASEDGSTWINLNNGEFNFKNSLKWIDDELIIASDQISDLQDNINAFGSDLILTAIEANLIEIDLNKAISDESHLLITATSLDITTEKNDYRDAVESLYGYVYINWLDQTYPLDITQTQIDIINTRFSDLEDKKTILVDKISEVRGENVKDYVDDNAVMQNFDYNKTKISQSEGIEVFDNSNNKVLQVGGIDTTGDDVKDSYGFMALRNDDKTRTIMDAQTGFKIQSRDDEDNWIDIFYVDTTGRIQANKITVGDYDSIINQTSDQISLIVNEIFYEEDEIRKSNIARLDVAIGSISSRVENVENVTDVTNTNSWIVNQFSTITQTAEDIELAVFGGYDGSTYVDGLEYDMYNKFGKIRIMEGEIDLKVGNDEVISAINLSDETISISANKIDLTGVTSIYGDYSSEATFDTYGDFYIKHGNNTIFKINNYIDGISFTSFNKLFLEYSSSTYKALPQGTWDFKDATIAGLDVTAKFG